MKRRWAIPAREVAQIIDKYPEFAFLNKGQLIMKKMDYIMKVTKKNVTYLRNIIRRHPDILIK